MAQVKNFQFHVNKDLVGRSLKEAVYLFLTEIRKIPISKRDVKLMIDSGKVHLKGKKAGRANAIVGLDDAILVGVSLEFLRAKDDDIKIDFNIQSEHILFEDDYIIAINKPSGLSTSASLDPKRDHLYAAVKRYLQAKLPAGSKPIYSGLHHRLDVDTSGVVVFTKKKQSNKGLGNQFENRQITKTYLAVAYRDRDLNVSATWEISNFLGRDKETQEKKLLRMCSVHSGGDPAETKFERIKADTLEEHFVNLPQPLKTLIDSDKLCLVRAFPKTGRTHQIRVHLFEDALPIVGDRFYFDEERTEPLESRLLLHAAAIELLHPVSKEPLKIEADFDFNNSL